MHVATIDMIESWMWTVECYLNVLNACRHNWYFYSDCRDLMYAARVFTTLRETDSKLSIHQIVDLFICRQNIFYVSASLAVSVACICVSCAVECHYCFADHYLWRRRQCKVYKITLTGICVMLDGRFPNKSCDRVLQCNMFTT